MFNGDCMALLKYSIPNSLISAMMFSFEVFMISGQGFGWTYSVFNIINNLQFLQQLFPDILSVVDFKQV